MTKSVLITGGAGFIGSHLANELLSHGCKVRALDSLVPQVHGDKGERPSYLAPDVELMVGDIRDHDAVWRALDRIDVVVHLVALVGVGQSMYRIVDYTSVNNVGTATLMQALSSRPVESLLVASSMSIYGEGLYRRMTGEIQTAGNRGIEQLKQGQWEIQDEDGCDLVPCATPEDKSPDLASVYALSKFDQEQMCMILGRAYGIPSVALRFFNTYGPNQALSNPYTGVLSNFASRVLNGQPPLIYEDGLQKRDFVSVYDVARACRMALENPGAAGMAINISSGVPMTVRECAERTVAAIGRRGIEPQITGKYRAGDIRHCFADISLARTILGWEPRVSLSKGLEDLAAWLDNQSAVDRGLEARAELAVRGLMV
jgi:dTDP-L-rhamnose 4-epimerase